MRPVPLLVCLVAVACATENSFVPQPDVVDGGDDPAVEDPAPQTDPCAAADNPDEPDQDLDGLIDACDCANDNPQVKQPSADLDTSPRDYNDIGCGADEVMVGLFVDETYGYVDGAGPVCAQRCDLSVTRDFTAESDSTTRRWVTCPAGEIVVGVAYREMDAPYPNDFLEAVTLVCGPEADPDNDLEWAPDAAFDASSDPVVEVLCPPGQTAAGTARKDSPVESSNSDYVDGITMFCQEGRWQ